MPGPAGHVDKNRPRPRVFRVGRSCGELRGMDARAVELPAYLEPDAMGTGLEVAPEGGCGAAVIASGRASRASMVLSISGFLLRGSGATVP